MINVKAIGDVPNDPEFWDAQKDEFLKEVGNQPADLLMEGALQAESLGLAINFDQVNQEVLDFAGTFTNEWWERTAGTTQNAMRTAIQGHIASGAPLSSLENNLAPLFGRNRAQTISSTEITRLFAEGNRAAYKSAGVREVEFQTVRDSRVDPICDALNGKKLSIDDESNFPPLHPRCRCLTDNQLFIYTAKGKVRFKNLKVGDLVLTHKGRFRPITEILRNEGDKRRKVKLFARKKKRFWGTFQVWKLPATEDHPVFTPQGWREIKDLHPGDVVYFAGKICQVCEEKMAYLGQQTCSEHCAGQLRARGLWDNPESRARAQRAISLDNVKAYQDGRRNAKQQTAKARAAQIAKYGRIGANIDEEFQRKGMSALGKAGKGSFLERKMAWLLDEMEIPYQRNKVVRVNGHRYFPDFLFTDYKIVVECDGFQWHPEPNPERDADLASLGYRVLHFSEREIREDLRSCAEAVKALVANDDHEYGVVEAEVVEIRETRSKRPRESRVTYNLEVAEDHSFVAAGFVVHNCWIAPITAAGEVLRETDIMGRVEGGTKDERDVVQKVLNSYPSNAKLNESLRSIVIKRSAGLPGAGTSGGAVTIDLYSGSSAAAVNSQFPRVIAHEAWHAAVQNAARGSMPARLNVQLTEIYAGYEKAALKAGLRAGRQTTGYEAQAAVEKVYPKLKGSKPVTPYALSSPNEYAAETVAHYLNQPELLRGLDPKGYDAVRKAFSG